MSKSKLKSKNEKDLHRKPEKEYLVIKNYKATPRIIRGVLWDGTMEGVTFILKHFKRMNYTIVSEGKSIFWTIDTLEGNCNARAHRYIFEFSDGQIIYYKLMDDLDLVKFKVVNKSKLPVISKKAKK